MTSAAVLRALDGEALNVKTLPPTVLIERLADLLVNSMGGTSGARECQTIVERIRLVSLILFDHTDSIRTFLHCVIQRTLFYSSLR